MNGPSSPQRETAYVIFAIGREFCALPRGGVMEILPVPRLWRPPAAPAALAGLLILSGDAVPVIALDVLFGFTAAAKIDIHSHVILVHGDGGPLGLLVERALDVAYLTPRPAAALDRAHTLAGCVEAELELPTGEIAHLLSLPRLLLAEENARISELRAAAQARIGEWGPPALSLIDE